MSSAIDNEKPSQILDNKQSLDKLKTESSKMITKYPDRVPVIVKKAQQCNNIPNISREKFLVPKDLSVGQLMYVIRQRIKLQPEIALFFMVGKKNIVLPTSSQLVSHLYDESKDENGFLYIIYTGESTFG